MKINDEFQKVLESLDIEDYREAIFNAHPRGEFIHLLDYFDILEQSKAMDVIYKGIKYKGLAWFRPWFESVATEYVDKNKFYCEVLAVLNRHIA